MTNKILFVDDEQSLLNGIVRRLGMDYEIETAVSGHEGLEVIQEKGPFAVIITDMRMPKMNGVEFVKNARNIAPDSVYVMLTGNQDQTTAIEALNEGKVFRFLNKPCKSDELKRAINVSIRQYRLINAEKELLHRTFSAAIGVLTDVLEVSHPSVFSRTTQIQEIVESLAENLNIEFHWEFKLASKLSLLGFAILNDSESETFESAENFDQQMLDILENASTTGSKLIEKIPRLETVADIIKTQSKSDGRIETLEPSNHSQMSGVGSTLLRIAIQIDFLSRKGFDYQMGKVELKKCLPSIAPELLEVMEDVWPGMEHWPTVEVFATELKEGMCLAEDLQATNGAILLRQGRRLTVTMIEKLKHHSDLIAPGQEINIYDLNAQLVGV